MQLSMQMPATPARGSQVDIGTGLLSELPAALAGAGGRSVYWIWDAAVWELWHTEAERCGCPDPGSGRVIRFAASEANKRLGALEGLARELVRAGADRGSALVAVGGGVTGDVVGFLASIYMRGIPCFQVPTTLLAQVDSSIGGKTGVDLPEGKNLLGTFHQPERIWMDPQFLTTLPEVQFRQGMAEVIKTAMIGDEPLWAYLEAHQEAIRNREPEALQRVIGACCRLKARVVEADEKEAGLRRVLNLGHTVGHAIERLSDYTVPHGDAVAIGMVVAAQLAFRLGRLEESVLHRLVSLCAQWGLPTLPPGEYSPEAIVEALRSDKKRIADTLHFILPVGVGAVIDYDRLDQDLLRDVLRDLQQR